MNQAFSGSLVIQSEPLMLALIIIPKKWNIGARVACMNLHMSQPENLTWSSKFKWNGKDGLDQPLTWNGTIQSERPNMAMHVSLGFAQLNDSDLLPFAANVVTGLTGNTDFPTPPITATVLGADRQTFEVALGKSKKGSVADTAAKDAARAVLVNDLRQDAIYVEEKAGGVASKITSTGYLTTTHDHSPVATMPKAMIKQIINSATTQLTVLVQPIPNAHSYEAQIQTGSGAWQTVATSSRARGILIQNLTPGTTYNVRVRAIGAGNSYGEWSDAVTHIAT